jgi:hypothetical protein
MRTLMATIACLLLAGCVDPVVLSNPQTGAIVQCQATGLTPLIARHQCVKSYENLGWVEMTGPEAIAYQRQKADSTREAVEEANNECREKRRRGELHSHVEEVQCSTPIIRALDRQAGANMAILDLLLAAKLAYAEQVDEGKLTEIEAAQRLAEYKKAVDDDQHQRQLQDQAAANQATIAHAAEVQAQGSLLAGAGAFNASTRPQPQGLRCVTTGTVTTCNPY